GSSFRSCTSKPEFIDSVYCLLITAACFSPLFVIGTDFGRWVFLWIAASAAIVFSDLRAILVGLVRHATPNTVATMARQLRRVISAPAVLFCNGSGWATPLVVLSATLLLFPLPSYLAEANRRGLLQRALLLRLASILSESLLPR